MKDNLTPIERKNVINESGIAACKILVTAFKICGLKSHIEQMFIDDESQEEYVLRFYAKDGFKRLSNNQSK